jgi:hypothetical protein
MSPSVGPATALPIRNNERHPLKGSPNWVLNYSPGKGQHSKADREQEPPQHTVLRSPWLPGTGRRCPLWRSGNLNWPRKRSSPPLCGTGPARGCPNSLSCTSSAAPRAGSARGRTTSAEERASFRPSRTTSRKGDSLDSSPPARGKQLLNRMYVIIIAFYVPHESHLRLMGLSKPTILSS